ncbi:MAG: GtrA family protein [Blautia sp.]|nr:GtrA family protein [Blautia sp.]
MKRIIRKCYGNSVLRYIFFGGLTTFVNMFTYFILRRFLSMDITVSNIMSAAAAIVFAYFTNSRFVFESKAATFRLRFEEFLKFISARLSTMAVEVAGVWLLAVVIGVNDMWAKMIIQFVVLVLNYVFSRFIVFRSKK